MPTRHPRSWLSLLLRSGDMGILLSPSLFPPWCYGCYPFGALPPPLVLFMTPPLTRTGVSWPQCQHSSPTKATKSSMTLALISPSIIGLWACWRRQSSPSTAFPIISSHWVWGSFWSCMPHLRLTPNLWARCSWPHTSSQQPPARLRLGALKLVRQWEVFRFLHWRRLGETLLRLLVLKSVRLWGVLVLVHLWGVLQFLRRLRLPLIPAISSPHVGPWHFSSRGIWLLPRCLPSGTPT
jgi:hypothetical protein